MIKSKDALILPQVVEKPAFVPGKPLVEIILLFFNDLLGFLLVIGMVSAARYVFFHATREALLDPQVIRTIFYVVATSLIIMATRGLYPGWGRTSVIELKQIVEAITLAFIITSVIIFIQGSSFRFSRSVFFGSWFFAMLLLPVGRFLIRKFIARFAWWGEPVVIIGRREGILKATKVLRGCPRLGLRPVAGLMIEGEHQDPGEDAHLPVLCWSAAMQKSFQNAGVRTNILAISPAEFRMQYPDIFARVQLSFGKTVFLINDDIYGMTWAEPVDIAGQPALISHHSLLNPVTRLIKQTTDYLLALIVMLPVLLVGLIIALWIKLDSPGPVLYRHERVGRDGKHFFVYKFRTMVVNANAVLARLLERDPSARAEWEKFHKLADDVRITRAGRWIRRLSLDELPQFINIMRGEMSLIGPRPLVQAEIDELGATAPLILRVRPGLTGWWQVMGRNNLSFEERVRLDIYYVSNWSLWIDLFIYIKTFWVLLFELGGR
ncbi:MAG TPA: undecaprenyl-phosphate galactose phosphotransferase WbaP [Anaerolineaceae bacterium]